VPEKSNTPHDDFFKKTFGRLDITKNFLQSYLPQNLREFVDFNELDFRPISYAGNSNYYSDLLFKSKIENKKYGVYFLFEYKSYNDRWSVMQIFNYLARIWMREKRARGVKAYLLLFQSYFTTEVTAVS
jgi:predicted transposase/invertase (TIGR01784 family)